jgi:hypothetical protein
LLNSNNQHKKNICLVAIGDLDIEVLDEPDRSCAIESAREAKTRIKRIRQKQIKSRRENVMTPLAKKLTWLHRQGKVPEKMLIIYGVSGTIPYRHSVENRNLTYEEKVVILQQRMERRFGVRWRERFHEIPEWLGSGEKTNWVNEGF